MLILGVTGAWAQTVTKLTNGTWSFTMPNGDRTLNVVQIEECGLVWQIDGQPVPTEGVSGYVGYESLVTFPTLSNEKGVSVRYGSTNTAVATINNANGNEITLVGAGTTTIYAVHDAGENYLYDSAYYTLTVNASYTLTLTSNPSSGNAGHLELDSVDHALPAGVVAGDAPYKYIVDPGTTVKVKAVPAPHYHLAAWNNTGGNALQQEVTITQNTVITGVFAIDTFTLTLQTNDINKGTVKVTNHNEAIVSHDPDANGTSTHKVNHGAEVIIQATPKDHYHLASWSNGATVNTDDTIHVIVTTDSTITANFAIDSFAITAVADPEHGGNVSGTAGNQSFDNGIFYGYGTEITLTASPNPGYHFVNWTNNEEDVVSTVPSFNFTVIDESEYMAHFAINTYTVAATANPSNGGSVNGADTYNHGATVTLTAIPATGYHFVNWTKGDEVVSADATFSFTVTHDSAFVANFAINTYTIAATFSPANSGTVTGAGTYNHGATCTLIATPAEGYHFVNWTKGGSEVSTEATYSFTVTHDSSFVANFAINTYTLTLNNNGNGNGSAAVKSPLPAGVTDNQNGSYTVNHGTTVTVEAIPTEYHHLVSWSNISGNGLQQEVTMTKDSTITCVFAIDTFSLTLAADGNGTVTLGGINVETFNDFQSGQYDYTGENFQLHVDNPLYGEFQIWHNNFMIYYYFTATITSPNGKNITKVELIRGNTSCYSGFDNNLNRLKVNHGTLSTNGDTATITGINATSLTIGAELMTDIRLGKVKVYYGTLPEGITENPAGGYYCAPNTQLTVKATPDEHNHLASWSNIEGTASQQNITVTKDSSITAHFAVDQYEVTASVTGGHGTVSPSSQMVNHGSTATFTAIPDEGYHAVWPDNSTANTYTTGAITSTTTVNVSFAINTYTLTLTTDDNGTVTIPGQLPAGMTTNPNGTYTVNHGTTVTVKATPNEHYHLTGWSNGSSLNENDTIHVTVTKDSTIKANFAIDNYILTLTPNVNGTVTIPVPTDGVTSNGNGTYTVNYGTTVTVNATAAQLHHVAGWSDEEQHDLSANATYSEYFITNPNTFPAKSSINVTVTGDTTMMATFYSNSYEVNAAVANGQGERGTVQIAYTNADNQTQTVATTATVTSVQAAALSGSTTTLTAIPEAGHHFVNWTNGDVILGTDAVLTTTEALTATANFAITPAELSWSSNTFTGYTYIDFNNYKPTLYNPNNVNVRYGLVENVSSVKVNPGTGYISNSFNAPILYTPGTYHVYAVHETDQTYYYDSVVYTLNVNRSALVSVSQNIEEGGSIAFVGAENDLTHSYSIGNAMIAYLAPGANFKATADANDGYHFSKWQTGNNVTGYTDFASTNTTTYTAPAEITGIFTDGLKAVFDTNTYALNVVSADAEMGSGNGSTTAKHFLNYEISATPNTGYHFVQWNDGNTANPRTVTLTSDSTFTATFAPDTFTITYMDGEMELNVDTFYYQQPITEYTTSKDGWDFIGWSPAVPDLMPAENLTVYAQWFYICHPVTDIDNNTYASVNIGNICWMTSNMRATHYADGQREIANIYVYATPLHPNADENLLLFGRLYDWYDALDASRPTKSAQVQGICPDGWVIPNEEDFETLNHVNLHTLLSSNYWVYNNGDNSTDFDLRPSGTYNITLSRYEELLSSAYLWSATATSATEAHCHEANCHCNDTLINLIRNKENAFSVRCVKKP